MRMARYASCLALAALIVGGTTMASPAAGPTRNGRIAYTSVGNDFKSDIFRVDATTGRRSNLTDRAPSVYQPVVSPDGRTILFHDNRSISRMNADGSDRRALRFGQTPAWSPDGKRIAFVDETYAIATMAADGRDVRRLVPPPGRLPAWSPDGTAIAYLEGSAVMIVEASGGAPRRLYESTQVWSALTWSPDSTRVAVSAQVLLESGGVSGGAIVVVPVNGGPRRVLTSGNYDRDPNWGGDGIAFVRSGRIYTVAAAGGAPLAISSPPTGAADGNPVWSPDGRSLAFLRGPAESRFQSAWVHSVRGTTRKVRQEDLHASIAGLVWSHDSRALFYSHLLQDNDSDLFTVEPDGSGRRQLTRNDARDYDPSFSPDGRWIVFVRLLTDGSTVYNEELFLMRADGTGVRRLTRWGGEDIAPSWSPDGSQIVFVRRTTRGPEPLLSLYTIRPDGTHLKRLATRDDFWESPSWSPDGDSIAVGNGRANVVAANGRNLHVVFEPPEEEAVARFPAWSPSGTHISFVLQATCNICDASEELWTVRPRGGQPRLLMTDASDAAWSPDGTRLVVLGADGTLRIVSANGTVQRKLGAAPSNSDEGQGGLSWQPRCTVGGSSNANRLRARASDELVCGFGGDDVIFGGPGRDRLLGGDGDDSIDARGGGFDVVGCGSGHDAVRADRADYLGVDCERVTRS